MQVKVIFSRMGSMHLEERNAAARVASPSSKFYVTIITGSGSHSSHGPILRSVVQRLFDKRGMSYQLERGGGAFRVNALSGHDLYQPDAPSDSKVVIADDDSFHQMAAAARRRQHHQGSFADTTTNGITQQSTTVASRSSHRPLHAPSHRLSVPVAAAMANAYSDPVPRQVAEEDTNLKTAVEKSRSERDYEARLQRQHEEELERAISTSKEESAASRKSIEEGQKELLKLVSEQSIADEQKRQEQVQKEFEDELLKAIEHSLRLEDLKSEEDEEAKASEEYLLQKALAESEKVKTPEDELLQKILTQSLLEEKRIEEEEQRLLEKAINDSSCVADNNSNSDDEELRRVIEMSKELF